MPRPRAGRPALLTLLLMTAGAPARALQRSAYLNWRFDDITTKDPSGSSHYSSWGQNYNLDLLGDVFHPYVGKFRAGGGYTDGRTVSSAVNNGGGERAVSYKGLIDFFSPNVQRYVNFSPNFSGSSTRFTGTENHTLTVRDWGWSGGVSPLDLPAIGASRQYTRTKDPYDAAPLDQRQSVMRENASYRLGGLSLDVSQIRTRIDNVLSTLPSPLATTQNGTLAYSVGEKRNLGLQYLSFHADYLRNASDDVTTAKSLTNYLDFRTIDLKVGRWTHSLSASNTYRRNLLSWAHGSTENVLITSGRPIWRGKFINSMTGGMTTGPGAPSRSLGVSPYANLFFLDGKLAAALNGGLGWSRGSTGAELLNDSLGTRLDLTPRRTLAFFGDVQTSETVALNSAAAGGQRTNRLGAGASRSYGGGDASMRYFHTQTLSYAAAAASDSDQLTLSASATPAPRLNVTSTANLNRSRSREGTIYTSKNFTAGTTYATLWGLRLNADGSYAGRQQFTVNAGASYYIGKTSLSVSFTHSATPLPSSFSAFNVSLSRSL